MSSEDENTKQLRALADLLDTRFELPFGIRIGLDGILGFVPVVGDFVTTALSLYLIVGAANLGCSPLTLVRMALNVVVEHLLDSVPFLGNFFDIFYKANSRNMLLLERHLQNPQSLRRSSRLVVGLLCFGIIAVLVAIAALSVKLLMYFWSLL